MSRVHLGADSLILRATAAVMAAVAVFAAVVSYSHIYWLGYTHGQTGTDGRLLPLSVDGLILAASLVMLHEARAGRRTPALAWAMLSLGVAATIGANVEYGLRYGVLGAIISAWPAVAFIGSVEMVMGMIRRSRRAPVPAVYPAEVHVSEGVSPGDQKDRGFFGPAESDGHVTNGGATVADLPQSSLPEGAERFAADLAAGRLPGIRAIRRELSCGQPRAQEVRDRLAALLPAYPGR